jgi:hypothetical protein
MDPGYSYASLSALGRPRKGKLTAHLSIYMEFFRNSLEAREFGTAATMQRLSWLLLIFSLAPLCIVLPMASVRIGVATIIAWTALIWIAISFARSQFHYIVLAWLALFPYCYYFLSYPVERSIFTLDRAFSLLLVIDLLVVSRHASALPLPRDVRVAGYLWVAYLCVCLVSIWGHSVFDVLGSYRLLVDGMLLPALLGLYAIRRFPITRNLKKMHACLCILMLGIAAVA